MFSAWSMVLKGLLDGGITTVPISGAERGGWLHSLQNCPAWS